MKDNVRKTLADHIPESTVESLQKIKESMTVGKPDHATSYSTEIVDQEDLRSLESTSFELGKSEYSLNDLFKIDANEIPFLLEGLIPKNNLTVLAGPSDVGKSTWYTQLVTEIVTGRKRFLWRTLNTTSRNVLVVSTEDDEVVFSIRIKRQLKGEVPTQEVGERLKFWPDGYNVTKRIEQFLTSHEVDLIVIDALSDVFKGDMNSGNATRAFLGGLSKLAKKYRTSILVVHHARKTDSDSSAHKDKLLGSVGIEGLARSVIFMSRLRGHPDQRGINVVKGNYVDDKSKSKVEVLQLDKESLKFFKVDQTSKAMLKQQQQSKPGKKRDPEDVKKAKKLYDEGYTLEEIGLVFNRSKSAISRWLNPPGIKIMVDESIEVP